jgi:hypothetical protein
MLQLLNSRHEVLLLITISAWAVNTITGCWGLVVMKLKVFNM